MARVAHQLPAVWTEMSARPLLRARDATDDLSELALHLQNASRVFPGRGSSSKALVHLLHEPWVLDLLERLVKDERRALLTNTP